MDAIVLPLPGRPRMLLKEFFAAMDGDTGREGVWRAEAFRAWADGPAWMVSGEVSEEDKSALWVLATCCEKRDEPTFTDGTEEGKEMARRLDGSNFVVHCPF